VSEAYRSARGKLVGEDAQPTPKYRAYLRFREAYEEKVRLRDEARSAARRDARALQAWPIDARRYADEVDAAMDRWLTLGFKAEVESALAVVRQHETGSGTNA
jgi:hypothetical protein